VAEKKEKFRDETTRIEKSQANLLPECILAGKGNSAGLIDRFTLVPLMC
jgi:hypothetical protein